MVDFGSEEDFRRYHWIFIGQKELSVEKTTFEASVGGAGNLNNEVSEIGFGDRSVNADNGLLLKSLCFLKIRQVSQVREPGESFMRAS